jgi:hypothetical protein
LLQLELELLNCDSIIALNREKENLLRNSPVKSDVQKRIECKVVADNYEHYRKRLLKLYNYIIDSMNSISSRYNGEFDKVFSYYFLQNKSFEETCELVKEKFSKKQVKKIISLLEEELKN